MFIGLLPSLDSYVPFRSFFPSSRGVEGADGREACLDGSRAGPGDRHFYDEIMYYVPDRRGTPAERGSMPWNIQHQGAGGGN
jgi:hypothetical protein